MLRGSAHVPHILNKGPSLVTNRRRGLRRLTTPDTTGESPCRSSTYPASDQAAFNGIAEASVSESLATEGSAAAQTQLQGALRTSYTDLVNAAGQLGITGNAADTMARKALGIPKNVNIDAWIADHASSTLDGIKSKAEGLDGKKVTIGIYTTEYFDSVDRRSALPDLNGAAPGSGRPGMATGGRVLGPGTTTSDPIPTMLSRGEFVIKASAAKAIGYGNLSRLNGGDTQPLRRMGYAYSPAAAPSGSWPAPTAQSGSGVSAVFSISQVDDPVGASHAVARRMKRLGKLSNTLRNPRQ